MGGILSGVSGAGAVPGTGKGFGFPDSTFSTGLNLPFRNDTGAPPGSNLTGLGLPGSQFFAARPAKYIDGDFFFLLFLSFLYSLPTLFAQACRAFFRFPRILCYSPIPRPTTRTAATSRDAFQSAC
jgi:hypothetical protein